MSELKVTESIFAVFGGIFGWFFGGFDGLMYTLLAFVIIDYFTGLTVAIINHNVNSEVGYRGIFKKVMIFLLVGIANLIDVQVLKQGAAFRDATIFFYVANEGISIIENSANLGLPVPKKLIDILAQLKSEEE